MDKRFFRRCARNAAFSLLGCLLLAAPAFAAQEITVSGAASLTNAFTEIKGLFEKKYPDIKVHTNFAASNPLLKQMEEGAPVDVFASADQETMDKAAAKKLVDTATRKDFALNDLVMVVPSDSKLNLTGAKDSAKPEVKRIAVGNPDSVPAGRYTKAALTTAGLWETLQPKYVFGASVRQALDYVGRGEVDAGFVYRTDAKQGGDKMKVAGRDGRTQARPVSHRRGDHGQQPCWRREVRRFRALSRRAGCACQVWLQQPAEVVAYTCGEGRGNISSERFPLPSPHPIPPHPKTFDVIESLLAVVLFMFPLERCWMIVSFAASLSAGGFFLYGFP